MARMVRQVPDRGGPSIWSLCAETRETLQGRSPTVHASGRELPDRPVLELAVRFLEASATAHEWAEFLDCAPRNSVDSE